MPHYAAFIMRHFICVFTVYQSAPSPIECQSNPEYFGVDKVESRDGNHLKQKQEDDENVRSTLPLVTFNVINIFLGFVCRLLLRLQYHEFFIETYWHAFEKGIMIYSISMLLYYIYLCCMPLVCLILAELRSVRLRKFNVNPASFSNRNGN